MVDENHFISMLVVISIFAGTMRLGNLGELHCTKPYLTLRSFLLGGFTIIEQIIAGVKSLEGKIRR